ncbi:MAG TPA: M56 family metallopeptidase [Bryobacteraceae bacterium]|nr:M56 family metallopeptidase [Bryobacteraceae bacterium]
MSAGYQFRLLVQCLSAAFLVHLFFSVAIYFLAEHIIRFVDRLRPARAVRFLLFFRALPLIAAVYAAAAITLPSYLRLETNTHSERVGVLAFILAAAAVSIWLRPGFRSVVAISRSARLMLRLKHNARPSTLASNDVWISTDSVPRVAVAGLLRPRLVVSEAVLALFSPEQLEMVLLHERAHQLWRDNCKRLLWLLLPDSLPFVNLAAPLDPAYKRLVEWAADDFAAAGDSRRSVALADALVAFARHQTRASKYALVTSFVDDSATLTKRIDRLLNGPNDAVAETAAIPALGLGALLAICLSVGHFTNLLGVHELLESLSQ